jgi:hypothetical protein
MSSACSSEPAFLHHSNTAFIEEIMTKKFAGVCAIALLFSVIFLTGCPQRTTINKINTDPGRYANKEVTIAGQVQQSFGALGNGMYQVSDGTGTMWVLSEGFGVPAKGAKVSVTGDIVQTATFAGVNYSTVLRETQKRK